MPPPTPQIAEEVLAALHSVADPAAAESSPRFFKPGSLGAGDYFVGVATLGLRALERGFRALPLAEIDRLLDSPIHEARTLALMLLAKLYNKSDAAGVSSWVPVKSRKSATRSGANTAFGPGQSFSSMQRE